MNKFEMYPELGKIRHICWERDSLWQDFLQMNKEYEARKAIPEMSETISEARKELNSKLMKWGDLSNFLKKWRCYTETLLSIEIDDVYHGIVETKDCKTDTSFIRDYAETILKIQAKYKPQEATNDSSK
jgi:hypothetical protein